jgi:hypothetical protein
MIDLNKIQCVVITYDKPACRELQLWLNYFKVDWKYSEPSYEIDVVKNRIIVRYLQQDVPNGKEYLFCIANDMVPMQSTINILTAPGPLVYCQSMGNEGRVDHFGDKSFSAACWRAHSQVLQSFGPPWFRVGHTGDRTSQTFCDCLYFKDRAQEKGWDGTQVGFVGHEQRCILIPHPDEPNKKWQMFWPTAWNEKEILKPIGETIPIQPVVPPIETKVETIVDNVTTPIETVIEPKPKTKKKSSKKSL